MPGVRIRCTACGVGLKAPAGKPKVRCPQCGAVVRVPPPAEEEAVEELEEVEEPARARPRDDDDEDRGRRGKRRGRERQRDGPWLIAVGAAVACFFVSFGVSLLAIGMKGLPEETEWSGYLTKLASLAFGVLVALILVAMGAISVKDRRIYDRWGNVTKGPVAIILAMVITLLGGALGGFVVYGLLLGLIRGR